MPHLIWHDGVKAFLGATEGLLLGREQENNVLLAYAADLRDSGERPEVAVSVHAAGGALVGAALMPPRRHLAITAMSPDAIQTLVEGLAPKIGDRLAMIRSEPGTAETFADLWSRATGAKVRHTIKSRLYGLTGSIDPWPTEGGARMAQEKDVETLTSYFQGFRAETFPAAGPLSDAAARAHVQKLVDKGRLMVWESGDGISCMAAVAGETPHGARIGTVFTPRARRGRGYAGAVVAALTRRLLAGGKRFCVLYADMAHPTANKIYEAIGYRPVRDEMLVDFEPAR